MESSSSSRKSLTKGCIGKRFYTSDKGAETGVMIAARKKTYLAPYKCKHCGFIHLSRINADKKAIIKRFEKMLWSQKQMHRNKVR